MVKQRDPVAAKVDALAQRANVKGKGSSLRTVYDANEPRKIGGKSLTLRLNTFEDELLKAVAASSDRSVIDWVRRTLIKAAEDQLDREQ